MDVDIDIPAPTRSTYSVSGTSIADVRTALSGRPEWGEFSGNLTITVPHQEPVTRITVRCRTVVTMPEWRDYGRASRAEQREWDRMFAALEAHEAEHERILRARADQFHDEVLALDPVPRSNVLRRMARVFDRDHGTLQRAFDRASSHGQRDGVRLDDV